MLLTKELNGNLYLSIAVYSFKNTSHFWLAAKAIAKRIRGSGNSPEDHLGNFSSFLSVILLRVFKTNSGSILRQANVFERENVGGRHSLNARCWQL